LIRADVLGIVTGRQEDTAFVTAAQSNETGDVGITTEGVERVRGIMGVDGDITGILPMVFRYRGILR
jgi:hypothetical protein